MTLTRRLVTAALSGISHLLFRIDNSEITRVPARGPLIVVSNHVHIPEIPTLYTQLFPRPVTGLVLADRWQNRWMRFVLEATGAIPLRRGEADVAGLRKGLARLHEGYLVVIMPEGRRSGDGKLQPAHPGAVLLALRSGAPILPVVHYGSEGYKSNLSRLRRTDFHLAVGRPFRLHSDGQRVTGSIRQQMIDEIMFQMAALLPERYRGAYADLDAATDAYLNFEE